MTFGGANRASTAGASNVKAEPKAKASKPNKATTPNIVINLSITKAAEAGNVRVLMRAIEKHLPGMNHINLATALHRLAKISTKFDGRDFDWVVSQPALGQLYSAVSEQIRNHPLLAKNPVGSRSWEAEVLRAGAPNVMPLPCMCVIAWSCSTLKIMDDFVADAIVTLVSPRLAQLSPFEVCELIWAFAQLSRFPPLLFEGAAWRLQSRKRGEFQGLCLAMSLQAFSLAPFASQRRAVFESIAAELPEYAKDLRPQEIASSLSAFAQLGFHQPELFAALGRAASEPHKLQCFRPQELAAARGAFARAGIRHEAFFEASTELLAHRCGNLTSEALTNLLADVGRRESDNMASGVLCDRAFEVLVSRAAAGKLAAKDLAILFGHSASPRFRSGEAVRRLMLRRVSRRLLADSIVLLTTEDLLALLVGCYEDQPPVLPPQALVLECTRRCRDVGPTARVEMLRCAAALSTDCAPCLSGAGVSSDEVQNVSALTSEWATKTAQALAEDLPLVGAGQLAEVHRLVSRLQQTPLKMAAACLKDALNAVKQNPYLNSVTVSTGLPSYDDLPKIAHLDFDDHEQEEEVTHFHFRPTPPGPLKALTEVDVSHRLGVMPGFGNAERPTLAVMLQAGPLPAASGAALALAVLRAAGVALAIRGRPALLFISLDSIYFDCKGMPCFKELVGMPSPSSLKWASPEEVGGRSLSEDDWWPAVSFRLGLLLHSCVVSGIADPYPALSPHRVVSSAMSLLAAAAPLTVVDPELLAAPGMGLLMSVMARCLRAPAATTGSPASASTWPAPVPDRMLVEASLACVAGRQAWAPPDKNTSVVFMSV